MNTTIECTIPDCFNTADYVANLNRGMSTEAAALCTDCRRDIAELINARRLDAARNRP